MLSCSANEQATVAESNQYLTVLGIAQDAGFPQAGCTKANCTQYWLGNEKARHATSLGLEDEDN